MFNGYGEPAVRAATLIRTPGALSITTVDAPEPVTTTVAATWGALLLALLEPGPVADSIRSAGPVFGLAGAEVRICAPCGGYRPHGRVNLYGTLRAVHPARRRDAALYLYDCSPQEELLDAQHDADGWLLAAMDLVAADWTHPEGQTPLDPVRICDAQDDPILRYSVGVCAQLNRDHPEVARDLAGRTAWLVELDRQGATLGLPGPAGDGAEYTRVSWPSPCLDLHDLEHVLANLSGGDHEPGCSRRR